MDIRLSNLVLIGLICVVCVLDLALLGVVHWVENLVIYILLVLVFWGFDRKVKGDG
jgi:hypothetical protein